MTIFVSHAGPHISNIGYMRVYEGLQALGGISFFLSCSCRMPLESCLGTPWGPSYEHIYKNIHFCKGKGRGEKGKREGKGKREKGKGREKEKGREQGKGKIEGKGNAYTCM